MKVFISVVIIEMSLTGSYSGGLELRHHSTAATHSLPLQPVSEVSYGVPDVDDQTIESYGEKLKGLSQGRSLTSDLSLHKIHSGLNTVGRIIKIVTTVLSLFGADNIDRWLH